jgi:hypothetical protein
VLSVKSIAEIDVFIVEAASVGDFLDGHVGIRQQLGGSGHLDAQQLLLGRAAEKRAEFPL